MDGATQSPGCAKYAWDMLVRYWFGFQPFAFCRNPCVSAHYISAHSLFIPPVYYSAGTACFTICTAMRWLLWLLLPSAMPTIKDFAVTALPPAPTASSSPYATAAPAVHANVLDLHVQVVAHCSLSSHPGITIPIAFCQLLFHQRQLLKSRCRNLFPCFYHNYRAVIDSCSVIAHVLCPNFLSSCCLITHIARSGFCTHAASMDSA